jgi:hypothetical protein
MAGVFLGLLGVASYFGIVLGFGAWLPTVRNDAIPNWIVVVLGLGLSVAAVMRADRRAVAGVLLAANVSLAAAFFAVLYVVAGPPIGSPAPAFTLADQTGKSVRLEDFRGAPLLLVFYRGHW